MDGETPLQLQRLLVLPNYIKNHLLLPIYFKSQPTDIFLASFMKTGTTWLKAFMFATINRHRYTFSDHYLLHHGPHSTFPYLDIESYPPTDFTHLPAPRMFATHYPRTILPSCITSCKLDPKDVLISKWHFMNYQRSKDLPTLSLDEAFELFCQGISDFGPFWEHVLSYRRASLESSDKILFLKYEEMMKQPDVVLRKLAAFMGKPFTAEEVEIAVAEKIVDLCSFENLRNLEVNKKGVEKFGKVFEVESRHFFSGKVKPEIGKTI